MDIIGLIVSAINHIVNVFSRGGLFLMLSAEEGLRAPLQQIGLRGAAQTAAVGMVPLLTMVAVGKILKGFLRAVIVIVLALFAVHALMPLWHEVPRAIAGEG